MKKFFDNLRFSFLLLGILGLSLLVTWLMITGSILLKEKRYDEHIQTGIAHMEAQEFTAAIASFEDAYRLDPTDDAALWLAKAWFSGGDTEKAIQVLIGRTKLYAPNSQVEELLTEYKKTIGIYPTVVIGGTTIDTSTTSIFLKDVALTEEDTAALSEFTDMVTLSLVNCGLTDIEFLRDCNKLMSVDLSGNPISDFTPLQGKEDLRTLHIDNTAITEFGQLHSLSRLSTLSAEGNWIPEEDFWALRTAFPGADLRAGGSFLITTITLGGVTFRSDAEELDLSGKGITDPSPLLACTRLKKLNLSDNNISWITKMASMTTLTELDLSGNRISNISALSDMTGLTHLNLSGNSVSDITPLTALTKLKTLNVSGNPVYHGHKALTGMTALESLTMQNALFKDSYLALLPTEQLTTLDLRDNKQLTVGAVQAFATDHPNCTVYADGMDTAA